MSFIKKYSKVIVICLCIAAVVSGVFLIDEKPDKPQQSTVLTSSENAAETKPTEDITVDVKNDNISDEKPATEKNTLLPEEKTEESSSEEAYCIISIRCDTLLSKKEQLVPEKLACVPETGIILDKKRVAISDGETVFDVLRNVTKSEQIHLEFVQTPAYNSAYIEGINNVYEFDGGELSGWTYRVNSKSPGVGCSEYQVQNGDVIEWLYTCDMGRDLN